MLDKQLPTAWDRGQNETQHYVRFHVASKKLILQKIYNKFLETTRRLN